MSRFRDRWALGLLAIAGLFAAGWVATRLGRSPLLFAQARPLLTTRGTITNALLESGYDYRRRFTLSWFVASNNAVGSFHRTSTGTVELVRFDFNRPETRTAERLAPLDERRDQPLVYWAPSPDGEWLLTVRRVDRMRRYQVYRGGHTLHAEWTHRYEGRSQPDWLNTSQGFVEWPLRESKLLARVYWLDTTETTEVDLATLPTRTLRTPDPLPQPCVPMLYSPLSTDIAAELLVLSPDRQPQHWARVALLLPESLREQEKTSVLISPTADRVAWLCDTEDRLPHVTISPTPPFFDLEQQIRTSLYVSRTDGSELEFLGRTRVGTYIIAARWSPEGDALTFVYQDALWQQPLPRGSPRE